MKFVVAAVVCLTLILMLFGYYVFMNQQIQVWEEFGSDLSSTQLLMVQSRDVIARFWWMIAAAIVAVCFGTACAIPTSRKTESR